MSDEQPLDLSICPACGKRLVETDGEVRCSGPKGCGRAYDVLPFGSKLDVYAVPGPQSFGPKDKLPQAATRTMRGADGEVRRVKVRT